MKMVLQVLCLVIVATAAAASADQVTTPEQDPLVTYAHDTNKAFNRLQYIKDSEDYSYAYEFYDWETGVTGGLYEIRNGEKAVGTVYKVTPQHERTTVNYTVDPTHGFQGTAYKDVQTETMFYGYGIMAGPLAYAAAPAPEEYYKNMTVLKNEDDVKNSNPYAQNAYRSYKIVVINYLKLKAPVNATWGYEVRDRESGLTRSQYESYQKDTAQGRFVEVKPDGTHGSMDYTASPQGFAVTTPIEQVTPVAA